MPFDLENLPDRRACKDCGDDFTLSQAELQWYADRQLHVPLRCKACRDIRRADRTREAWS